MRTATELVDAIIKYGNGFTKSVVDVKLELESCHKNVLLWDNQLAKQHLEICTSDVKKDDEQQWQSILVALSQLIKKNQMSGCWVPVFNSIEELDLKLEMMGV